MGALISKGQQNRRGLDVPVLLGVELKDAQEELFVILVCDGLPMGLAFKRAGFSSKHSNAPSNLFNLPRVQERAKAILDARRATGAVSLPEVTSMLQRVFAGAHAAEEFSAAHNAAFSLARIYGHVTDKSVIEHIRRPSRDPDAPSETALEAWAASLPVVEDRSKAAVQGPPASLLGPGPSSQPPAGTFPYASQSGPSTEQVEQHQGLSGKDHLFDRPMAEQDREGTHADVHLRSGPGPGAGRREIGNGASVGPVTGTPHTGGGSPLLENAPQNKEGTGTKMGEIPSFEELFG